MARAVDDLNPARVLRLFSKVLHDDLPLLDLACRPEHLLVTYLAVPPVRISCCFAFFRCYSQCCHSGVGGRTQLPEV